MWCGEGWHAGVAMAQVPAGSGGSSRRGGRAAAWPADLLPVVCSSIDSAAFAWMLCVLAASGHMPGVSDQPGRHARHNVHPCGDWCHV